jgi:hypothetical protein
MPISHAKSITVADATGTVTGWFGTSTVTIAASAIQLPSDWNSAHNVAYTITGNTVSNTTVSGTNIIFAGSGGVSVGGSNGSIIISGITGGGGNNATLSTFVPYFPASTSSQTIGGFGTSTASAMVFPIQLVQDVAFNHIKILQSMSVVTTSNSSGFQTITSRFALFSNNAGTLSSISSGSFSICATLSSISGTVSFPTTTATSGYGYGTSTWGSTATAQSLFGTGGNREIELVFGGSMSLAPQIVYLGIHQRQSTSNTAVGLSSAFVGNAMNATSGVGKIGRSSAAFSNDSALHLGAHGFYTSTGSAGYSGTALPASMILTAFNNNMNVMPMVTMMST